MKQPSDSISPENPGIDILKFIDELNSDKGTHSSNSTSNTKIDHIDTMYDVIKQITNENLARNAKLIYQTRRILKSDTQHCYDYKDETISKIILNLIIESLVMNPEFTSYTKYKSLPKLELFSSFFENFPVYQKIHRFNCLLENTDIVLSNIKSIKLELGDILKGYNVNGIRSLQNKLLFICFINEIKRLNLSQKSKSEATLQVFGLFNSIFKNYAGKKMKKLNATLLITAPKEIMKTVQKDTTKEKLKAKFISFLARNEGFEVTKEGILKLAHNFMGRFFDAVEKNTEPDINDRQSSDMNPIIFDIPDELIKHSHFVCPVSLQEATSANPPVLLKCGHAICKLTMRSLIDFENNEEYSDDIDDISRETFNCPICRREVNSNDVRGVNF